jgi:chemotaxis protein CheC
VVDLSGAVLTTAFPNFGQDRDFVFCVGPTPFTEAGRTLTGHFLLLPDLASLRAIFEAIRLS